MMTGMPGLEEMTPLAGAPENFQNPCNAPQPLNEAKRARGLTTRPF